MAPVDDVPLCVLENIARSLPSLDPQVRRGEVGRLILTREALYYVQGWEIHEEVRRNNGGAVGMLLEMAPRPSFDGDHSEGQRLLAEVKALAPAEQVRVIAGSSTVPTSDIESAGLSLLASNLKIITEARGEVYNFAIPRRDRKPVQAWLAGLPRK